MNERPETPSAKRWVLPAGDPLLWLLTEKLHLRTWWIVVGIVLLTCAVTFGGGYVVSYVLFPAATMIRVDDPRHLIYALVVHLAFVPVVWLFYLWQSTGTVATLRSLQEQHVFVGEQQTQFQELTGRMRRSLNGWYWPLLAFAAVALMVTVQTLFSFPATSQKVGKQFWFYDLRYYWLNTAVWFVSYYVTAMVVIKSVLTQGWLYYIFQKLKPHVDPYNSDGVGGLGAIGRLAGRYGAIGIAFGVIAASYSLLRVLIGADWAQADVFLLYGLYLVLTPTVLLPIWAAHERMLESRCELLAEVLAEINTTQRKMLQPPGTERPSGWSIRFLGVEILFRRAKDASDGGGSDAGKRLETLQQLSIFIKDNHPTWPLRVAVTRNVTIVGLLPLVTGIVGLIGQF